MAINELDVIEVSANLEFNGTEDLVNVYQYQVANILDPSEAAVVDDIIDILEVLYNFLLAGYTTYVTFRDLRFRNVTQGTVLGTYPWKTMSAGLVVGDSQAPGVGGVLNMTTPIPNVILRKYYGPFAAQSTEPDGTYTALKVATLLQVGSHLLVNHLGSAAEYRYGYLSPKIMGFIEPNAAVANDVPGYQRRRKQGRGS